MEKATPTVQSDLKVVPAGGKFKVHYTIGVHRHEEPLEKALEDLNSSLFFGPEIKLQQTDIRLVALNRRSYNTVAEVHNLHRATPLEIQQFILRFALGQASAPTTPAPASSGVQSRSEIRGFKVRKSKTSLNFALVYLMSDGSEDEQHFLTNTAIRALREQGAFDPRFDVRMSPTNDLLMAYGKEAPSNRPVETVPVAMPATEAEWELVARRAQDFLNKYRSQTADPGVEVQPLAPEPSAAEPAAQAPVPETARQDARPPNAAPTAAVPEPVVKLDPIKELFQQAHLLTPEGRNTAAFRAIALCLEANLGIKTMPVPDRYSLLSLNGETQVGPHFTGFVLTIKHNLAFCRNQMTVRFGLDHTLLENDKTGDTWKFPSPAFLGLSVTWEAKVRKLGGVALLVTGNFLKSMPPVLRQALKQSGILFQASEEFGHQEAGSELIWPASREDTLFYQTALGIRENFRDATGADIFPIGPEAINMSPGQPVFVGFKRSPRRGIIYEAGDDFFARFDPDETEISAADYAFPGHAGIVGFALDGSMEMCAIYDPAQAQAGFEPPVNKLIRFVSVDDLSRVAGADERFTRLGLAPAAPA